MALGVEGVRIGTWTAPGSVSGCTVVLPPPDTVGAMAVRGSAPGTREAAALSAMGKVQVCHGVLLSGGSAYGLSAADGVVRWLEARGQGYAVGDAVVPIVGAAIVLDAAVAHPASRPGERAGWQACEAASEEDPPEGRVGVGAGCTVAKVGGLEHAWRGGQGVAVRRAGGVTVGVLVANNAVGEVVGDDGAWLVRARIPDTAARFPLVDPFSAAGPGPTANTVIGCIVTDALLSKRDAYRVADLGHSGIARALRPAHTEADGDALCCLATGRVPASVDLVAHLAADAVAEAVRRGPLAATSGPSLPGGPILPGMAGR
jgi:L-aminopeptidase/D-esterase-like protein